MRGNLAAKFIIFVLSFHSIFGVTYYNFASEPTDCYYEYKECIEKCTPYCKDFDVIRCQKSYDDCEAPHGYDSIEGLDMLQFSFLQ